MSTRSDLEAGVVSIPSPIHAQLKQLGEKRANSSEIGGIFIGCYRGPHIEVTDLTMPGGRDRSRLFKFVKRDPKHQRAAMHAWKKTEHTHTYVGEWHTHPSGNAHPSSIDLETWREIVMKNEMTMVFCISTPREIGFFRLDYASACRRQYFDLNLQPELNLIIE